MSGLEKTIEKVISRFKSSQKPEKAETPITLPAKVYLKALPLQNLDDVDIIKREIKSGNILVIRVTPLAKKSVDDVKRAVNELTEFIQLVGGDIARLGGERVVMTPSFVRIWRKRAISEVGASTAA